MVARVDLIDIAGDSLHLCCQILRQKEGMESVETIPACWDILVAHFPGILPRRVDLRASLRRFFKRNQIESTLRNEASLSFPMKKRKERGLQHVTVHHRISSFSASVLRKPALFF